MSVERKSESYKKETVKELKLIFNNVNDSKVIETNNGVLVILTNGISRKNLSLTLAGCLKRLGKLESELFKKGRTSLLTPKVHYSETATKLEIIKRRKMFYLPKTGDENGDLLNARFFKYHNEYTLWLTQEGQKKIRTNIGELTILVLPGFDFSNIIERESTNSYKDELVDKEIHKLGSQSKIYYYFP